MPKEILCPYCHLPQVFTPTPSDPPGEAYCPNCGGPVPWGPQAAVRPTTVLWIDDDRLLLGACVPTLERHGYRVLVAHDGTTGRATATRERPDIILLDVVMPTLNGLEVCRQLRADRHLTDTPIILLTALEDVRVGRAGKTVGATTTLRKPSSPEYLVEVLDKRVGRTQGVPRL